MFQCSFDFAVLFLLWVFWEDFHLWMFSILNYAMPPQNENEAQIVSTRWHCYWSSTSYQANDHGRSRKQMPSINDYFNKIKGTSISYCTFPLIGYLYPQSSHYRIDKSSGTVPKPKASLRLHVMSKVTYVSRTLSNHGVDNRKVSVWRNRPKNCTDTENWIHICDISCSTVKNPETNTANPLSEIG